MAAGGAAEHGAHFLAVEDERSHRRCAAARVRERKGRAREKEGVSGLRRVQRAAENGSPGARPAREAAPNARKAGVRARFTSDAQMAELGHPPSGRDVGAGLRGQVKVKLVIVLLGLAAKDATLPVRRSPRRGQPGSGGRSAEGGRGEAEALAGNDRAEARRGEEELEHLEAVLRQHRDAVAVPDAPLGSTLARRRARSSSSA